MFNLGEGGNQDFMKKYGKNGSKVDQVLEFLFRMIPLGEKPQRLNQIHSAPESPRRKRRGHRETGSETETEVEAECQVERDMHFSDDWAFEAILPLLIEGEVDADVAKLLVDKAHEEFSKESLLVDLEFEYGVETVIVGDIHGQFNDLLLIFRKFGRPSATKRFIFNGDLVDRGPRSVACWLFICALKIAFPQFLFVTRGNHETRTISLLHSSFAHECMNNYSQAFFVQCQRTFDELPLSYTLNRTIFITHGGLPNDLCLDKMRQMPKDPLHPDFDQNTVMALLWNDPTARLGYGGNSRGPRVFSFGPDVTERFLQKHNLSLLIRSHEYQVFGHQYTHNSKCLTIFSCPDYQKLGNTGAVAFVDSKGNVKVEQFYE